MSQRSIDILRTLELRGPNIWTYVPALEVWIDIGELEDFPSNTIPGFVDRLVEWLPCPHEHTLQLSKSAAASCDGCAKAPGRVTSSST
jgi:cyanophycin synthetase